MQKEDVRYSIARVKAIEKELAERKVKNKIFAYNVGEKVHVKQIAFHRSAKRNRWVFGGNRSGKTECGAVEAVYMLRGIHPYRQNKPSVNGWAVSLTSEVQKEVAQKKILEYLNPDWIERITMSDGGRDFPEGGVVDTIYVRSALGGISSLTFKTCSQGRERFQGASLDFVWFDEEPPKEIYDECRMRVLDKSGDVFGTMTPLKGLTWVYDEIYLNPSDDPEIWYENMEWADNPFLDVAEVERLGKVMSAEELESRRYGRFRAEEGLVYPEFEPEVHVIDPFPVPYDWQSGVSVDPGLNNPLSCHFYAKDYDGVIYVIAEHYERGKEVAYHAQKILALAESLGWHRRSDGRLEALIDSAANQKTLASVKSVSELFFENGIAVNARVNKDMFSGISRVRSLFSARPPRIYIFRNCVNMIRELKGYWWGSGDRPVKRDDHAMDELRYYVMSDPCTAAPKAELPEHIKYKQKLLKTANNKNKRSAV